MYVALQLPAWSMSLYRATGNLFSTNIVFYYPALIHVLIFKWWATLHLCSGLHIMNFLKMYHPTLVYVPPLVFGSSEYIICISLAKVSRWNGMALDPKCKSPECETPHYLVYVLPWWGYQNPPMSRNARPQPWSLWRHNRVPPSGWLKRTLAPVPGCSYPGCSSSPHDGWCLEQDPTRLTR